MIKNKANRLGMAIAAAYVALSSGAAAQDLPFNSGSTGADGPLLLVKQPGPRSEHAMAYDIARDRVVMFGGRDRSFATLDDTWEFDGTNWVEVITAFVPPGKYEHSMAYDVGRGLIVMYGGGGSGWNMTYEYDGTNWTEIVTAGDPSWRQDAGMAYDVNRGVVVMYGGGLINPDNETWEYDGTNWTEAVTATSPPPKLHHTFVYDTQRDVCVAVGGSTNHSILAVEDTGDRWEYNGIDWTNVGQAGTTLIREGMAAAYDAFQDQAVYFGGLTDPNPETFGSAATYGYEGTSMDELASASAFNPGERTEHAMAYDSLSRRTVLYGGENEAGTILGDTWVWTGTDWNMKPATTFDVSAKSDGIWNFTTIDIQAGAEVYFSQNTKNTPVFWLATGNVDIDGFLYLNGEPGSSDRLATGPGTEPIGGPGGFRGGVGGINGNASGTFIADAGLGPGGGAGGLSKNEDGQGATHSVTYGNAFLQPINGGSGGGGGASNESLNGLNGGGGGGAILIASSRDITVNGTLTANGGAGGANTIGPGDGGPGAGGSIRLAADRVTGDGYLEAIGGGGGGSNTAGRVRIEGFFHSPFNTSQPPPILAAPTTNLFVGSRPELAITQVDGNNVASPPTGSLSVFDVTFSSTGTVDIVVQANSIPNGSPVDLRITIEGQIIDLPSQPLAGGQTTFNTTVPAGAGRIQAFTEFTP